jgi:hypothetical protein
MNATRLFGPAVAGVMVATINLESVYFLQAGLYVVSCGLLLFVPTGLGAASAVARGSMFREIGNGLAYVARDSRLRQLNISMLAISFFAMPYVMLLVRARRSGTKRPIQFLQSVSGVRALSARSWPPSPVRPQTLSVGSRHYRRPRPCLAALSRSFITRGDWSHLVLGLASLLTRHSAR